MGQFVFGLSKKKKKNNNNNNNLDQQYVDMSSGVPIELQKRKSREVTFYILDSTNENCIFG